MADDTMQEAQSEIATSSPEPQGIGGWLVLLIVCFGLGPIAATLDIIKSTWEVSDQWEFLASAVVLAATGACDGYIAIALARKWPRAPTLAMVVIIVGGIVALFNLAVELSGDAVAKDAFLWVFAVTIQCLWVAYLLRSRRVKNTYPQESSEVPPSRVSVGVGAVLAAFSIVWAGTIVHSSMQRRIDEQYPLITPSQWLEATRRMDPNYAQRFENAVVAQARSRMPDSTITLSGPARFDDFPSGVRTIIRYTTRAGNTSGAGTTSVVEVRAYYHAHGSAHIDAWCDSTVDCLRMDELIAEADGALMAKVDGSQMKGILPDDECTLTSTTIPSGEGSGQTMTCHYTDSKAVSLSLTRRDLAAANRDLRSHAQDTPEFRRAMVNHVKQLLAARRPAP